MDFENKENLPDEGLFDDVLGAPLVEEEIGPDEHAVASAGLIHPDDMELEMIIAEHRPEEEDALFQPEDTAEIAFFPEEELTDEAYLPEAEAEKLFFGEAEDAAGSEAAGASEEEAPVDEVQAGISEDVAEFLMVDTDAEDTDPQLPVRKGRPKRRKGYGLLGLPHLVATAIWLAIIVVIGVSLGRTLWLCCSDLMAFGKPSAEATITIGDDDTIETVSQMLAEKNLIRYPGLFKTFAELTGKDENISVGTFHLNSRLDYNAMINGMTAYSSDREEITVMLLEGATCAQIFQVLEDNGVCTVEELEDYAANGELDDYWFLEGVERGDRYCLEGYLFPDTYNFYTNDEPGRVIEKFLDAFDARFTDIMRERLVTINESFAQWLAAEGHSQEYIDSHPITIREVVIIASMIEKESTGGEESYDISSVIYNRLTDSSQPPYLNIDATLIYALGGNIDPITGQTMELTYDDLELDNPYNTYKYAGLTPGPIANPSQESLNAAVSPKDTDYYYYALDPETGEHRFFKTYKEHLAFLDSLGG